jgi:hypothetical protein
MVVSVPWESQSNVWWNETCADIMEHFGLPGGKYRTEVSTEYMKFIFYDDRDALMCRLLISDKIC